jgi:hypothetical protein
VIRQGTLVANIIDKLKLTLEIVANITEVLLNSAIKMAENLYSLDNAPRIRISAKGPYGISISYVEKGKANATIDDRLAKIESARESLVEALSAVDELKERAQENKRDLEFLTEQIQRAEIDKKSLSGELQTLKGIASLDSESVRKVLRLPTKVSIWTERVIAFGLGILASTIASLIYEHGIKKLL